MDSNGQNGTYKPKSRSSSMRKSVSKADSDLLASSPTSTLHSGTLESSADAKLNLHSPVHRNNSATEDTLLALTNGTIWWDCISQWPLHFLCGNFGLLLAFYKSHGVWAGRFVSYQLYSSKITINGTDCYIGMRDRFSPSWWW